MNYLKQENKAKSERILKEAGIEWEEFNNGMHFKIGRIDFWPTTTKWIDNENGISDWGAKKLVAHIKRPSQMNSVKILSPEQMFEIAKKVKPNNLFNIIETLHKEIYKGASK